jgi:hypothetical protein
MGYMNGHMAQNNALFKNFKIINLLRGAPRRGMPGNRAKNWLQISAKLLKKY